MRIGSLRHRLVIEANAPVRQADGSMTDSWSTFATVWGSVEPISGRERFLAERVESEITHRIRIRYLAGVIPKMRVAFGTRHLLIEAVLNLEERRRELEIMAREAAE